MRTSTVFFCRCPHIAAVSTVLDRFGAGNRFFFLERATLHGLMSFGERLAFVRADKQGRLSVQFFRTRYGCAVQLKIQREPLLRRAV